MRWHTLKISLCYPPLLVRNCIVTRILEKTTSQKQFYQWKEKVQKNTSLSFWWKAKSSSSANLVDTVVEFPAFGSGSETKYRRASAFRFVPSTTMVFVAV